MSFTLHINMFTVVTVVVHLCQMVGLYSRWMIPGLLPFIWSLCIMKVRPS